MKVRRGVRERHDAGGVGPPEASVGLGPLQGTRRVSSRSGMKGTSVNNINVVPGRPESEVLADLHMDNDEDFGFGVIDTADLKLNDTSWMRRFSGDLRTLDVMGLWRAAGLEIVPRADGVSYDIQCPNRREHSDPEASSGTVLYKRPLAIPNYFCGRTSCRGGRFSIKEALLSLGVELVDLHCAERFRGGVDA